MCWYCIRLDIYSILVLAYCFANKSFTEHHRTLSKWWATEETPTLEALDCSFPCFLCYTLVCKPWRFHFLHGWSLIYGIFSVNTRQKKACGEWNLATPKWNSFAVKYLLRKCEGRISFHIERSEIFHNFRKEIISHSASAEYFTSFSLVSWKTPKTVL